MDRHSTAIENVVTIMAQRRLDVQLLQYQRSYCDRTEGPMLEGNRNMAEKESQNWEDCENCYLGRVSSTSDMLSTRRGVETPES